MSTGEAVHAADESSLLTRWRLSSEATVWLRAGDWEVPAVDAIARALVHGLDLVYPAERLGAARAQAGVGITEAIDDLLVLLGEARVEPGTTVIRALCQGWAEASPTLNQPMLADDESGLATAEYLSLRLRELYGQQRRQGRSASATHALTMVDVSMTVNNPWQRMARHAMVGQVLTDVFGYGVPAARLSDGLFAVLVPRDDRLGPGIASLREELAHRAATADLRDAVRQPPRLWIEPLPQSLSFVEDLLESLRYTP